LYKKEYEEEKTSLADVLREMDLNFLEAGEYGITVDEAVQFIGHKHFVFLDVRLPEEIDELEFSYAKHIPLEDLPDRISELPQDKFIIVFCMTGFRASMAYAYMRTEGYDEIKIMKGQVSELTQYVTSELALLAP